MMLSTDMPKKATTSESTTTASIPSTNLSLKISTVGTSYNAPHSSKMVCFRLATGRGGVLPYLTARSPLNRASERPALAWFHPLKLRHVFAWCSAGIAQSWGAASTKQVAVVHVT